MAMAGSNAIVNTEQLQSRFAAFKCSSGINICAVIIACIGVPALMATPPPFTTYEEGGQIEILGQNVEGAYGFSFSPALTCAIGSGSAGPIQCTQAGGCFDTLTIMKNAGLDSHFKSFLAMVALGLILMISMSCTVSCCAASAFNPDPKPLFPGSIDKSMSCCSSCAESTVLATTPLISAFVLLIGILALWKDAMKAVVAAGGGTLCTAFTETALEYNAVSLSGGSSCDLPASVIIAAVCASVLGFSGFDDMSAKNKPAYTGAIVISALAVVAAAYQLFTYIRLKSARDLARGDASAEQQPFYAIGSGPAPWMGGQGQAQSGTPPANWAGAYAPPSAPTDQQGMPGQQPPHQISHQ